MYMNENFFLDNKIHRVNTGDILGTVLQRDRVPLKQRANPEYDE